MEPRTIKFSGMDNSVVDLKIDKNTPIWVRNHIYFILFNKKDEATLGYCHHGVGAHHRLRKGFELSLLHVVFLVDSARGAMLYLHDDTELKVVASVGFGAALGRGQQGKIHRRHRSHAERGKCIICHEPVGKGMRKY